MDTFWSQGHKEETWQPAVWTRDAASPPGRQLWRAIKIRIFFKAVLLIHLEKSIPTLLRESLVLWLSIEWNTCALTLFQALFCVLKGPVCSPGCTRFPSRAGGHTARGARPNPPPPGGRETGWVRVASVLGFQEPASVNYERKRQREGRPAWGKSKNKEN